MVRHSAFAPLVLAVVLFTLNHAGMLAAWFDPPEGYVPHSMRRLSDYGQYLSWMQAFRESPLIGSYQAPWHTEPGFFNALIWLIAQVPRFTNWSDAVAYQAAHFLVYLLACYALLLALRTFTTGQKQFWVSFAMILCTVPIKSLGILPLFVLTGGERLSMAGIGEFAWYGADGFFHAMPGSILTTFGTACLLLAFAFYARYVKDGRQRDLVKAGAACFFLGLIHPHEVIIVLPAAGLTLLLLRRQQISRAVFEMTFLCVPAAAGMLPNAYLLMRSQWLQHAAENLRWWPDDPLSTLLFLGLPAIGALAMLVAPRKQFEASDWLLAVWFVWTLTAIYIPFLPRSQHLLDGIHYVAPMLLTRELFRIPSAVRLGGAYPRFAVSALLGCLILSLFAWSMFVRRNYQDGKSASPEILSNHLVPEDELHTIRWLRKNALSSELVLAPPASAPWIATVPMHSFASHWVFGLDYLRQAELSRKFYAGTLPTDEAQSFLRDYGVRYVIVPHDGPAMRYLEDRILRTRFSSWHLFELPEHYMKAYPGAEPSVVERRAPDSIIKPSTLSAPTTTEPTSPLFRN